MFDAEYEQQGRHNAGTLAHNRAGNLTGEQWPLKTNTVCGYV